MKNLSMKICNEAIHPGETLTMAMPLPALFSCAPLYLPIKICHGKQAGPTLIVIAAMHGNEINGTEIINRLFTLPALKKIAGTLITIPVMNVYGFTNRSRTLRGGIDLDTTFPGSEHGSHAARIAHLFTSEIFDKADYCIDLQTGALNYSNLPQIYINFQDENLKHLARAFNTPVVLNAIPPVGSLRHYAQKNHIPYLLYEAGEAMRFDEYTIKIGIQGIINVMRKLGMLPERTTKKTNELKSFFAENYAWIHSPSSGISQSRYKLGQHIAKGEILSILKDPFGVSSDTHIRSPHEGIIIGKNNLPLVHEGEEIVQLAIFPEMQQIESHLKEWENDTVIEIPADSTTENQ
ncbi:MAG: peptidase M14 [Gammaproteobacteria bacterium RIFCSPHIGHO2_12_FULL_45_12]|nr:MAG: peptidase M14 [Gammaproteobacteria bacterium RIFCSPHIGHO2_12_FULL_45_12]